MTISVAGLASVPVIGFSMRLVIPGQDVVTSRYTGQVQVIGRGPGYRAGSVTWMPTTDAHLRTLAMLYTRLEGQRESVRLSLPRRYRPDTPIPAGARIKPTSANGEIDNGAWKIELHRDIAQATLGAAGYTMQEGQWVNVAGRLYQVASRVTIPNDGAGVDVRLFPPADPYGLSGRTSTATILNAIGVNSPDVNARAAVPDQGVLSQAGHANDPIVFDWQEVVAT